MAKLQRNEGYKECYNCEGWGKVSVKAMGKCPDCRADADKCECGSSADIIGDFDIIDCPICAGTGLRDKGQGRLF